MIKKFMILFAILSLLTSTIAKAFYDDFESHSSISSFLVGSDYDPDAVLLGGTWSIVEDSIERVQVHRSPVTPLSPYTDAIDTTFGDQFLHVMRGNNGSCRAWLSIESPGQTAISNSGKVTIKVQVYNLINGADSGDAISITGFDSVVEDFSNRAFDLVFRNNGTIWIYDGSGNPTAGSYTVNAWNDIEIEADFITDTYSISVNGSPIASGLGWAGGDLSKIQTVVLSAFSFDSSLMSRGGFDNFSVSTDPLISFIGYYHPRDNWVGIDEDMPVLKEMANVVVREYHESSDVSNPISHIRQDLISSTEQGIGIIPDFSQFFRTSSDPNDWELAVQTARQYVDNASALIPMISVIDEPSIWGISKTQAEAMVDLVKIYFPDTPTWVNHLHPTSNIVQNADYISATMYVFNGFYLPNTYDLQCCFTEEEWFNGVEKYCSCANPAGTYSFSSVHGVGYDGVPDGIAKIKAAKDPNTQILLLGEAGSEDFGLRPTVTMQQLYFDLAASDPDIVGLLWFKWGGGGVYQDQPSINAHKSWIEGYFEPFTGYLESPCSDWGIRSADINEDCYVDFEDFAAISLNWINCTEPNNMDCVIGQ